MTTVVNIDYVLLAILIEILLKPTRVLFSHRKAGENTEQLRTVVAYQNPFTGDYCVRKSRVGPKGYVNQLQGPESPDSGLSDEYEPLQLDPQLPPAAVSEGIFSDGPDTTVKLLMDPPEVHKLSSLHADNSLNKTWNWNYKEYQI
ncbi:unnamed protein product [Diatraea saccharalis]|uniref:Uncharacterized protein n=1 Tax=Diatraea saccharalis TaxID=40085 RepID=A0A9N9WH88_9NEOP|nr:unnamed protein product [Diatraea saccharalis]